jgi:soluble lytic murein transglycosylase
MTNSTPALLCLLTLALLPACDHATRVTPPAPPAEQVPATVAAAEAAREGQRDDLYETGLTQAMQSTDPDERSRAVVRLALLHQQEERYEEAASSLAEAAAADPVIAPFLRMRRVDVLRQLGRYDEAIAAAQELIREAPGSGAATNARIILPALHQARGDRAAAARALAALSEVTIDEFTESRIIATSDLLAEHGAADLSADLRLRVLSRFPRGRFTERLYGQLTGMPAGTSPLDRLNLEASIDLADQLARANRYDQALDWLGRTGQRFSGSATDPRYRWVRLRSLFHSRNYDDAVAVTLNRGEPNFLEAELLRGRAHWRRGRPQPFVEAMDRIIRDAPATRTAHEARVLLASYYSTDQIDYDRAIRHLDAAIAGGHHGNDGVNHWTRAWIEILAGRDEAALRTLQRYLTAYPDADYTSNALFWSGKIHERQGRMSERNAVLQRLIDFYPYNYYSYRAREILGRNDLPPSQVASGVTFPALSGAAAEAAQAELGIIRELLAVGMNAEAGHELRRLAAGLPEDAAIAFHVAHLYHQIGEPVRAMGTLQRNFRSVIRRGASGVPQTFWEILYPLHYRQEIEAAARRMNHDPFLIASIIRQESGFNPDVVSNAGAVGLMQIMPHEVRQIGAAVGMPNATRADLFDPAKNVLLGAAEFRQKLTLMNGNRMLAIAAYNAGPTPVGRWIANTPIEDIDFFIESIPFAETRLYVKLVNRNLKEYRRIYGGDTR